MSKKGYYLARQRVLAAMRRGVKILGDRRKKELKAYSFRIKGKNSIRHNLIPKRQGRIKFYLGNFEKGKRG